MLVDNWSRTSSCDNHLQWLFGRALTSISTPMKPAVPNREYGSFDMPIQSSPMMVSDPDMRPCNQDIDAGSIFPARKKIFCRSGFHEAIRVFRRCILGRRRGAAVWPQAILRRQSLVAIAHSAVGSRQCRCFDFLNSRLTFGIQEADYLAGYEWSMSLRISLCLRDHALVAL